MPATGSRGDAELHGHSLWTGAGAWKALAPRLRIDAIRRTLRTINRAGANVIFVGIDRHRHNLARLNDARTFAVGELLDCIERESTALTERCLLIFDEETSTTRELVGAVHDRHRRTLLAGADPSIVERPLIAPSHHTPGIQLADVAVYLRRRQHTHPTEPDRPPRPARTRPAARHLHRPRHLPTAPINAPKAAHHWTAFAIVREPGGHSRQQRYRRHTRIVNPYLLHMLPSSVRPSGGYGSLSAVNDRIPPALLCVLTADEAAGLLCVLDRLGPELADLYDQEVSDHRESRGDNGQLFGMKLWVHGWFRYEDLFADDQIVQVVADNGSWALHIGRLRIGIYRQGSHGDDDVHHDVPHADSETKRSYGASNAAQLELFPNAIGRSRLDDDAIAALFALTITHFGNSREGLVKWYVGAQSQPGEWGWVIRQPDAEPRRKQKRDGAAPLHPVDASRRTDAVVPFDQRPVKEIEVLPHRAPARERRSDDSE